LYSRQSRSEEFLKVYRMLESALEKKYGNGTHSGSVVFDYIRENPDSEPFRHDLNICREIRNILSHNADAVGEAVVEPSEAIIATLTQILKHVLAPPLAIEYGTPCERIMCAHPNDMVMEIMHRMNNMGFSHVPILDGKKLVGVFSVGGLFNYLERKGLNSLSDGTRMWQLKEVLGFDTHGAERYLFMSEQTSIVQVRAAFEKRSERNCRLSAVFITRSGRSDEPLLAMLTPWDALKDAARPVSREG